MSGEIERSVRYGVLASRWLLVPMYLGLGLLLVVLLIVFVRDFFNSLPVLFQEQSLSATKTILSLATVLIVANVVLVILQTALDLFSPGSKEDTTSIDGHSAIDFARLRSQIIGGTFVVSLLYLLSGIVDAMGSGNLGWDSELIWVGGILAALAGLMLVLAVAEWFASLSR